MDTIWKTGISDSSANMHLIPSNSSLYSKMKKIRKGQLVLIKGFLVDMFDKESSWFVKTSMVRTDSGAGACEVILVSDITFSGLA